MKRLLLGLVAGLIIAYPASRGLIWWSEYKLPKPVYQGVKVRAWSAGKLIAQDVITPGAGHECSICHTTGLAWLDAVTHCDLAAWGEDADDATIIRGED